MKTTLVLGASDKSDRYSYKAVNLLSYYQIPLVAVGLKNALINEIPIIKMEEFNNSQPIHTITLYLNAQRQKDYYDFILSVNPQRVIFNPGTENVELISILEQNHIDYEEACTLVLLNTGQY